MTMSVSGYLSSTYRSGDIQHKLLLACSLCQANTGRISHGASCSVKLSSVALINIQDIVAWKLLSKMTRATFKNIYPSRNVSKLKKKWNLSSSNESLMVSFWRWQDTTGSVRRCCCTATALILSRPVADVTQNCQPLNLFLLVFHLKG